MKHLFLLSTLLIMICMTACQEEEIQNTEEAFESIPEDFYLQMEKGLTESGAYENFDAEKWFEDYLKTIPSKEDVISELALEGEEAESREHFICNKLRYVARLRAHYGLLSSNDIAQGKALIRAYGGLNRQIEMNEWPSFYVTYGVAQGLSGIATPTNVFNSRDLDYAIYELQYELWDCGISALYN